MRLERADPGAAKGWYAGPWNSNLTVSVGYAHQGIDNPHVHREMHVPVPRSRLGLDGGGR